MNKIQIEIEEWQKLIGRAIIASGEIELVTYKCLTFLPTENIFEVVADLPFSKRIDLICRLIEDKPLSKELRDNFLKLLNEGKEMAVTRNLIAHNPMQISVFENEITGDMRAMPEIVARRKNKKLIRIKDMRKFTSEVERVSLGIHALLGQVISACNGTTIKSEKDYSDTEK